MYSLLGIVQNNQISKKFTVMSTVRKNGAIHVHTILLHKDLSKRSRARLEENGMSLGEIVI